MTVILTYEEIDRIMISYNCTRHTLVWLLCKPVSKIWMTPRHNIRYFPSHYMDNILAAFICLIYKVQICLIESNYHLYLY